MKITIKNFNVCLPDYFSELIEKIADNTTALDTLTMNIEDIKAVLDASDDKLNAIADILIKVQAEITTVTAIQAQTIADLQAKLEIADVVPDDVQTSLDTLNESVGQLNTLASALDAINPDTPVG